MKQILVKTVLKSSAVRRCVYVLSDGGVPHYVGLAEKQSVQERLLNHALSYFSKRKPSRLTKLIYESKRFYGDWKVSVFRLQDVSSLRGRNIHCLKCAERAMYDYLKFEKGAVLSGNYRAPNVCGVRKARV